VFAAHASILLLPIVEGLFVDAKFTTNVHDRSAIFFFFKGFYDLTLGVSAFFSFDWGNFGFFAEFYPVRILGLLTEQCKFRGRGQLCHLQIFLVDAV
jgi:hypothetical protein